jgi:outer membrane protein TolC
MREKIVCWLFVVLLLSGGGAQAEPVEPVTLSELITLGLRANLGLQIERLSAEQTGEAIIIEEAVFDPQLFAVTGYQRDVTPFAAAGSSLTKNREQTYSAEIGLIKQLRTGLQASVAVNSLWSSNNDPTQDLDPSYRSALQLELNQPLLRDLGREINLTDLKVARNRTSQSVLDYLARAQRLALELEIIARQLVGQANIVNLRRESVRLAEELYQANQQRFDSGIIPVSEVQEAETALADRLLALSLARQQYEQQLEELRRNLDFTLPATFSLQQLSFDVVTEPLAPLEQMIATARKQRLDLKINRLEIDNSLLVQDYRKNQLKPRLDLQMTAGVNGLAGDTRTGNPSNTYQGPWFESLDGLATADGYQWRAGLEFSIPLGNRSALARSRQAERQLKQNRYRQHDLQALVTKEIRQQRIELERTQEQLTLAGRFTALAEKSLNQESRRVQAGLSDTFRLLAFQDKMIAARIGRINAQLSYHLAQARMDFARGRIFDRYRILVTNLTREINLEDL